MDIKIKRRQELELEINKVAFGGQGIAHVDDFIIFVENSLPGDVVTARIRKARKKYAEAYPLELLKPSPLRQAAPCEHFGHCGGCKWQNIAYEHQLRFKKEHVTESLAHIGGVSPGIVHDTMPAPDVFGYRNKMEFSFSDNRWLTPEELKNPEIKKTFALGLHVPRHFDRVLDINHCWLQPDVMNRVLTFARIYFKDSAIPVYNNRSREGILRHLVLRYSFAHNQLLVNVVSKKPLEKELNDFAGKLVSEIAEVSGVINTINDTPAQVARGSEMLEIYGESLIREKIGPYEFEISPHSFFQTNSSQAQNLYTVARDYAQINGGTVWDLYCGAGSIAVFVAAAADKVKGFEIVESAVHDAYRNAQINGVDNCEFVAGDLRFQLNAHASDSPEVVICDPPRAGMHKDVLESLLALAPPTVVYVSCNPATMARDLSALTAAYHVTEVQPVDMFPHTYHIESVAKLVKR